MFFIFITAAGVFTLFGPKIDKTYVVLFVFVLSLSEGSISGCALNMFDLSFNL